MRIVTEDFQTLTQTVATVFEGLDFDEIAELDSVLTKVSRIGTHPFRKIGHALQMKHDVYDFPFETVHYVIERIFRDEEHECEGETMFVTYLEHTDGGTAEPETVEYTIPIGDLIHGIMGLPMWYNWN